MSTQPYLNFDREDAKKERGIGLAAGKHEADIQRCRAVARIIAARSGTADMERVRQFISERCWEQPVWGNWCGAVFKDGEWEPTGEFVEVTHPGGHRRGGGVRVWRLRGER